LVKLTCCLKIVFRREGSKPPWLIVCCTTDIRVDSWLMNNTEFAFSSNEPNEKSNASSQHVESVA
jgi:hypothetical protein